MPEYASLGELCQAALSCTACELSKHRTQVVPGEGAEHADVMFIGEGPGYHEDQQGRPFVGPAGKLLDELIASIGMVRSDVYIANMVKCRPPGNRDPEPAEAQACQHWLDGQIEHINPKIIVTLGRHSLAKFLPGESITRCHGKPRRVSERIVLPIHHPAAALYQQSLRKTLEEDFQQIPRILKQTEAVTEAVPAPKQLGLF
ncbi:MAG: uracil-DNA glycosylase [Dehalococcoidia bacterium]